MVTFDRVVLMHTEEKTLLRDGSGVKLFQDTAEALKYRGLLYGCSTLNLNHIQSFVPMNATVNVHDE